MSVRHILLIGFTGLLSACGSADLVVDFDDPVPNPTINRADVRAFDAEVARLENAPITNRFDQPSGTVSYTGQVGSNITLDGSQGYAILGDMRMSVGFSGIPDVSGDVRNINLLRDGTPVQQMGGRLFIDGTQFAGRIEADADGVLSLVDDNGTRRRTNMALDLDGQVVNDAFVGDGVRGEVTGFGDGFQLSGPTSNIVLDGGGAFVGTTD